MPFLTVLLDGEYYHGQSGEDMGTIEQGAATLYEHIELMSSLKLPLKDGRILVLGKDAVKRAVFFVQSDSAGGQR
jgi:hypothetical protein